MLESASNVNPSQTVEIQFGPFMVEIEKDSGQLRYLRAGTTELLRGIYGSVRRSDWGTVLQFLISNSKEPQVHSLARLLLSTKMVTLVSSGTEPLKQYLLMQPLQPYFFK
jgi:hypothetical protein